MKYVGLSSPCVRGGNCKPHILRLLSGEASNIRRKPTLQRWCVTVNWPTPIRKSRLALTKRIAPRRKENSRLKSDTLLQSKIGRDALPPGWTFAPLGDVAEIIAGQSPPGETYTRHPAGLPFFQGKVDFGQKHPVPRAWCTAPIRIAEAGDILISVRAPVGPTNIADRKCCIGRGLAAIRPYNHFDSTFIRFALKHEEAALVKLSSGSTFAAITMRDLTSLAIPLPPL